MGTGWDRAPPGSPLTHAVMPHVADSVLGLFSNTLSDNPPQSPLRVREFHLSPHLTDEKTEAQESDEIWPQYLACKWQSKAKYGQLCK